MVTKVEALPVNESCNALHQLRSVQIANKLVKRFPEHPRQINLEKADRLGSEVVWREAKLMMKETEPLYYLLQDIAVFQERTNHFLLHVDQTLLQHVDNLAPLSLDYTPHLLSSYMQLFCNAVRLHLLAQKMPRELIIQLHTLLLNLSQVQDEAEVVDPPYRLQLVAFVQAFSDPIPKIQAEFQNVSKRVGQVLESSVFPVILAFSNRKAVQESQLLNVASAGRPSRGDGEKLGLTAQEGWRGLQWLYCMREWAFMAFIACPGETIRPGAVQVAQVLLDETMRIVIYKEHCMWVHPVFQAHIRPTMMQAKNSLPQSDRKALKKSVKNVVEVSHEIASSGCMQEHRERRILVQQALQALFIAFSADPAQLPKQRELALAALAYARAELLWYFLHVNENAPMGVFKALISTHQPLREIPGDASVAGLLSAMHQAIQLLLQYRSAVQAQALHDVQALVNSKLQPGLATLSKHAAETNNSDMHKVYEALCGIVQDLETLQLQRASGLDMEALQESWEGLAVNLHSSASMVTAADVEAASGDEELLLNIAQAMSQSRFVHGFQQILDRTCSLSELSFSVSKVRAAMLSTKYEVLPHVTSWLYALSWLQEAGEDELLSDKLPTAEHLAEQLMQMVTDQLLKIIRDLHQVGLKELEQSLTITEAFKAYQVACQPQERSGLFRAATIPSLLLTHPPGSESQPGTQASTGPFKQLMQAAAGLLRSLSDVSIVRLSRQLGVCPPELAQDAVRNTIIYLIPEIVFPSKELEQPTVIERNISWLMKMLGQLACDAGCDLAVAIREGMLATCYAPMDNSSRVAEPPAGLLAGPVAEWLIKRIVMDMDSSGICMAPAKRAFVSTATAHASSNQALNYTSPSELAALVRTLGLGTAKELAARSERPLSEAISVLDGLLARHQSSLDHLHAEILARNGCWDASRKAVGSIGDLSELLDSVRAASRSLYFRQLLASVVAAESQAAMQVVQLSLGALGGKNGLQSCSLLGLPQALSSYHSSPEDVDPALSRLLNGDGSLERLERWRLWPLLLGLSLWSPAWNSARFLPAIGATTGNLDAIIVCAEAFAFTLPEVALQQSRPVDPPDESLKLFYKCVDTGLLQPDALPEKLMTISNAKTSNFSEICTCHSRVRSAYQQACFQAVVEGK